VTSRFAHYSKFASRYPPVLHRFFFFFFFFVGFFLIISNPKKKKMKREPPVAMHISAYLSVLNTHILYIYIDYYFFIYSISKKMNILDLLFKQANGKCIYFNFMISNIVILKSFRLKSRASTKKTNLQ
jgi:hypothetical protein